MNTRLIFVLTTALTIIIHAFVGWQISLLVPLAYAFWQPRAAIARTMLQVSLVWLVLMLISYAQAPAETVRMTAAITGILTRSAALPVGTLPVLSLLFAALLGLLCGWAGSAARSVYAR